MESHQKYSINTKLRLALLIIGGVMVSALIVNSGMGYIWARHLLKDEADITQRSTAMLISYSIDKAIGEVELATQADSSCAEYLEQAVSEANAKYQKDAEGIRQDLLEMNKRWIELSDNHPTVKEYLENETSYKLRSMTKIGEPLAKILVTDKYGGLVALTGGSPEFYQGDKDWWLELSGNTKEKICIGDVIFDDRTGTWGIPFATSIVDKNGELIGTYRNLKEISALLGILENFHLGRTGRAALVDDKGYIIFYPGTKPFTSKFCSYENLQKLLKSETGSLEMDSVYGYAGKVNAVFEQIDNPILLKKGINWYIVVLRDKEEIFHNLMVVILGMIALSSILITLALVLIRLMFKGVFISPIMEVREGIRRIGMGDLDYKLDIKTGDIIEALSDSVNEMSRQLKSTMVPASTLNTEIIKCEKAEEKSRRLSSDFVFLLLRMLELVYSVKNMLSTAFDKLPGQISDKQKDVLKVANNDMEVLERNMTSLLDMAKLEAGNMEIQPRLFSLRELIKKVVFVFEARIREKGLDFRTNLPKGDIEIYVDPDRIEQVFAILMRNAIKLTEKGYIEIVVRELKDEIECSVVDTGAAIDSEDMPRLFNVEELIDHVSKEKSHINLGLRIVRGIIELNHGKIWAASEPDGVTIITFRLPKHRKS